MQILAIPYGWYLTFAIISVGSLIIALGFLLYKYYNFLFRRPFLGNTLPLRLINIAITAAIFPKAIDTLMVKPIMVLLNLVKILSDNISLVSRGSAEITSSHYLVLINNIYDQLTKILTKDIINVNFFLALAFLGLFTLFVNKIFLNAAGHYQMPTIKGIKPLQQNLFLFILMAFSLFLVISAMIAIPVISKTNEYNSANIDRYDSLLTRFHQDKDNIVTQYQYAKPDTTYALGVSKAFDSISKLSFTRMDINLSVSKEKESVVEYFKEMASLQVGVKTKYDDAIAEFEKKKNAVFTNVQYRIRERSSKLAFGKEEGYYLYLVNWYTGTIKKAIENFKDRKQQMEALSLTLKTQYDKIKTEFPQYRDTLRELDTTNETIPQNYFKLNTLIPWDDYVFSYNNSYLIQVAEKKRTVFQQIGEWLVDTNSIDLVLIIGMFGFGLLGAAISSFITAEPAALRDPETPLVDNLSVVIIRGFSAAIVIFLATKGSIAVINSGTNDPNPYVLFFACLVGAVFSEPIWDWSKDKILSIYKKNTTTPQPTTSATNLSFKPPIKPVPGPVPNKPIK